MESGLGYVSLCRFSLHNGSIEHLLAAHMLVLCHVLLAHVVTFRFMLGLPFHSACAFLHQPTFGHVFFPVPLLQCLEGPS